MASQQHAELRLTSTTAPGKTFASREELAQHYKSDWHKYNLKRREAGMPMLNLIDFTVRYEAAMALRREREGREERSGRDHLKDKSDTGQGKKKKKGGPNGSLSQKKLSKRQLRQQERNGGILNTDEAQETQLSGKAQAEEPQDDASMEEDHIQEGEESAEPPTIDPRQSLFDKHISPSVVANVQYMYRKYGFFLPDQECIADLEGLIGYCAEKVKLGQMCLCCQKTFGSWQACRQHMINSKHCKLRYEAGVDLEEFDVFYDFSKEDEEFMESGIGNYKKKKNSKKSASQYKTDDVIEEEDDDESGEWEDVDSDEEMEDESSDQGMYAAYEDEIANHGFNITPLGELIFPDGRIIGHRGLSRYYKQRFTPEDSRTSVIAAKRANGERILGGRVYDTYGHRQEELGEDGALQLAKAGLGAGAAQGRSGRGILVNSGAGGGSSFTAVSLYRYRAAVNKARREEFQGRRLQQRTTLAMNKMDKKANRMMTNVSMTHSLR